MKAIGGNINHQKSFKTKMPPFYGILTSILTGQPRQICEKFVTRHHTDKTCFLIDMSVPSDTNVSLKTFEKLGKYKDMEIEVTKMWNRKRTTLPIVIGALGMVANTAPNYVSQISGAPALTGFQNITLTGTAHVLRKVLSM